MFKADHMGVSSSQASSHTKSYSCPKQSTPEETPECGDTSTVATQSQLSSEGVNKGSLTENLVPTSEEACKSSLIDTSTSPKTAIDQKLGFVSDDTHIKCGTVSVHNGQSKRNGSLGSGIVQHDSAISTFAVNETLHPLHQDASKSALGHMEPPPNNEMKVPASEKLGPPHDAEDKHWNGTQSEILSKDAVSNSSRLGRRVKTTAKSRKKYMLRCLRRSDRVMQYRSQEKPKAPESSTNLPNVSSNVEKTRKKKKKRERKSVEADEYSIIRKNLRYLLNRIGYEQSLITAYSAEGWKGLSLEKLKPEKELQRATSEILRRKSKIRDLFQRIDSLCGEGRFPESLFDSDGQISSEDIFCAKCGSKDLTADNDIILCDGACDRGFHQYCLVPPLLKEDIPPDDQGWLCPGCDCKVDCIDLLNESQGTNISISDSWEKVFPEAAAPGQNPDQNFGPPSDDSDDNDYDPDIPEIDEKSQGDESSSDDSDDSDFTSDELEAPPGDKQQLGLSSEDSGDDDYDPDAPDLDDIVKEESSSSDFTSDSEDLAATLDNNELSGEDERRISVGTRGDSTKEGSKRGRKKKQSLQSELLSIEEPNPSQDGSAPISGKRNVERLDYKKLYDETYGNVSSDSSDDEDFTDDVGAVKRRKSTQAALGSANGNASVTDTGKQDLKETEYVPKRSRQRLISENTSITPTKAHEGTSPSSSCGKTVRPSGYRRLGETVTKGLYRSFKENQYPDRDRKEHLAEELGITYQQVTKWFENARWSFNHSSSMDANRIGKTPENNSPVSKTTTILLESAPETVSGAAIDSAAQREESPKIGDAMVEIYVEDARETVLGIPKCCAQNSKTPKSRKRKHNSGDRLSDLESKKEEAKIAPANLPKAQETRVGGRVTRSKSAA
ncbi:homeobox protein HAT3.1 [Ricinus communis]|uniref:Homeobox protein HAT3.1, putative n=1 Tax=Ricinus communis TaxID=3988 RepID=B9SN98_RICCO|nr:homeobox protein HAT3.1 [Ricinus communis]XP_015579878.1 homeobox protein HAT3.1 [Ricinus communis]EEF34865.1 Homeobox protein HAT3.1, putative [Ricinus communis]|eukprot:XP_002527467.1 homeobox protein HAT3.1 [Ricinus communis]